ncbi:MAG: GIY-YIG nuclease family protein [bacterium]|nr:GIY-YIG nuclease family protein [bacterium]
MSYYVYIITNKLNRVLYTGVTNNLKRRLFENKNKLIDGFSKKYNLNKLVFFEEFENSSQAIESEKRIKGWLRSKKISLIETNNQVWKDLGDEILR